MRAYNWARIARGNPSCHARNLTAQRFLHAMQALFQLSYSPTRPRMLPQPDRAARDQLAMAPHLGTPSLVASTTADTTTREGCDEQGSGYIGLLRCSVSQAGRRILRHDDVLDN